MRHIFLLRHAKSSWAEPGLEDFERPLNERGHKSAEAMGRYLSNHELIPDIILCSPARRTRETLADLRAAGNHALASAPVDFNDGIYEARTEGLLGILRGVAGHLKKVMLIGHNPGLEHLTALLTDGHGEARALTRLAEKYPTGALAVLTCGAEHWLDLGQGACHLASFIRPADM